MTKYLIFNSDGYLKKIAETDDEKNQLLQYSYIAQSCADQKFEDIKTKEEEEPGWARLWEFEYDNILIVLFSCNYVLVYTYIWLV